MCVTDAGGQGEVGALPADADISAMQHSPTPRAARIETCLREEFSPVLLRVSDDSARHAGHAGARPEGETHFSVLLVSDRFRGQSRLARSRAVHAALAAELQAGLHALALSLRTPEEQRASETGA